MFETNLWIDMAEFFIGIAVGYGLCQVATQIDKTLAV
jgi:hypothetical protein